jgi:hypothetical protein
MFKWAFKGLYKAFKRPLCRTDNGKQKPWTFCVENGEKRQCSTYSGKPSLCFKRPLKAFKRCLKGLLKGLHRTSKRLLSHFLKAF